jgi:hypothetical protein
VKELKRFVQLVKSYSQNQLSEFFSIINFAHSLYKRWVACGAGPKT